LYFPSNTVTLSAKSGDLLVIAKKPDDSLLAIIAEKDTTIARQMMWLFGFLDLTQPGFSIRENLESEHDRIEFASRFILENIGISVETKADTWLEHMIQKFGGTFPKTKEFSAYARSTLNDIDIFNNRDEALMSWMEREEILFRAFEKYLISERLSQGFNDDVDGFIAYSLSVQNRRKSRAGFALENHLEHLFHEIGIKYSRTAVTENKAKPDFIFPGIKEYHSPEFNPLLLTMLGVKSSCKDRWRQVLSEADRIENKHLLTLEAAISKNQTDEMISKSLQLVLPKAIHQTYSAEQQIWLMDVTSFSNIVLERQKKI
jgi:hypothetical protein